MKKLILAMFAAFLLALPIGYAYTLEGGGICSCTDCDDCMNALNDNANCYSQVNLTADITNQPGNCINNPANFNNKTFDCQGHTIDGNGIYDAWPDSGIYLSGKSNNTIKNCLISEFVHAIELYNSSNNSLINNLANYNTYFGYDGIGIYLYNSSNNILINNTADLNDYIGIYLYDSSNNILINNTANYNDDYGIDLSYSLNSSLINNTANNNNHYGIYLYSNDSNIINNTANYNNEFGILLKGISVGNTIANNTLKENKKIDFSLNIDLTDESFDPNRCNNIIENNTGSGDRPIKYFNYSVSLENEILSELILCNADNSNINNVTIAGSDSLNNNFLVAAFTDNSNFTKINSSNNAGGIFLFVSNYSLVKDSIVNNNSGGYWDWGVGIVVFASNHNRVINNSANNNSGSWSGGIVMIASINNTVANNTVNDNQPVGAGMGIYLIFGNALNTIANNTARNNAIGISVVWTSINNTITGNALYNNWAGIALSSSNYSNVTRNLFYNNNYDLFFENSNESNVWLNHFFGSQPYTCSGACVNNSYCFEGEGNFYEEDIPTAQFGPGECGQSNVSLPSIRFCPPSANISWTRQSSALPIAYDVFFENVNTGERKYMGTTANLYLEADLSTISIGRYRVRVVPWVNGSRYNGTNGLSPEFNITQVISLPKIKISSAGTQVFLAFTEGDWQTIRNRIPLIEADQFLNKIAPSFAYGLGIYYPIKILLKYRDIDIEGDVKMEKGAHVLVIENNGTVAGRPQIVITGS